MLQYKGLPIDSESAAKMMKSGMHGISKSEIVNRQSDGCGGAGESFTNVPSGMCPDNPFKSKKQQAYLAINKPAIAKKFAMHTK